MRLFLERLKKAPMELSNYREGALYQFHQAKLFRHNPLDVFLRWVESTSELLLLNEGHTSGDAYSGRSISVIVAVTGHDAQFALARDKALRVACAKDALSKFGITIADIVNANYRVVPDRERQALVTSVQEIARARFDYWA